MNVIKNITNVGKLQSSSHYLLQLTKDKYKSIDTINYYFANIDRHLSEKILSYCDLPKSFSSTSLVQMSSSFALLETNESEIESIILSLKKDSAAGWDGLTSNFLKNTILIELRRNFSPMRTYLAGLVV